MACLCLGSNLENESSVRKSIEVNSEISEIKTLVLKEGLKLQIGLNRTSST